MFKIVLLLGAAGVCLGQGPSNSYLPSSSGRSGYAGAVGSLQHRSGGRYGSFGSQYSVGGTSFGGRSASGYGSSYGNRGYGSSTRSQGGNQYGRQGGYGDDSNSEPASYEFKYDVNEPEYGVEFGHQEQRDGDNTNGAYYVLLPDGRRQLVEYTADASGYHPRISYTESAGGYQRNGGYQSGGNYQSGRYQSKGGYQGGNTINKYQSQRNSQSGGYQSGY